MLFSFLTRFFSSDPQQSFLSETRDDTSLQMFVAHEGGKFFLDFTLFHHDRVTLIDTLIFLPNIGIFIGESIVFRAAELKKATLERASKQSKHPATTRFDSIESKIRRKLEDVLSFDSTPIHRFVWMKNLTEEEFDSLDSTFHKLLPKSHLIFHNDSLSTIQKKFYSLGEYRQVPYSTLKIIGALNTHTLILPTPLNPSGTLLSPQQNLFLTSELNGAATLLGGYGSGKSTLLVRKALLWMLTHPREKILIITPTLLGGELLRDQLVSLLEYGALNADLNALGFYTPISKTKMETQPLETLKIFQEAALILCDDAHLFEESFIQKLHKERKKRPLLLTSIVRRSEETLFELSGRFRRPPSVKEISCDHHSKIIITLLLQLRQHLEQSNGADMMIAVSDKEMMSRTKEAVDEYFALNCRMITPSFSLQHQDLDSIIITSTEYSIPLARAHVFLIGVDPSNPNYSLPLSRASETLTIISCENSPEKIPTA